MDGSGTASLRALAVRWSLEGDRLLLDTLQNIHERILSRCTETSSQLAAMAAALDDSHVAVQNVNNRFAALSNAQFVESRVYEDDEVGAGAAREQPKPPPVELSEEDKLRKSIKTLESMHEPVRILYDSDSESDSDVDNDSALVWRLRDAYRARPLPYIIGSQPWKNKWHVGLIAEDSDSDTSSKREKEDNSYGSESETEKPVERPNRELHIGNATGSTTSSMLQAAAPVRPERPPAPADVAAELARRLGGDVPQTPLDEPEYVPPQPAVRKIYKPEQPLPGQIFSNEPPPLDTYESDENESEDDYEQYIAELDKKLNVHTNKSQNVTQNITEDLFRDLKRTDFNNSDKILDNTEDSSRNDNNVSDDLFSDLKTKNDVIHKTNSNIGKLINSDKDLFQDIREDINDRFAGRTESSEINSVPATNETKPIGGISLFGSNKDSEDIGAAILKRRQRKSSSDEESEKEPTNAVQVKELANYQSSDQNTKKVKPENQITERSEKLRSKETDIFDDLFSKAKNEAKNAKTSTNIRQNKNIDVSKKPEISKYNYKNEDLFKDNLFDDIDDLFSSNLKSNVTIKGADVKKSIFDDADDLFADIAINKDARNTKKDDNLSKTSKSLFDSDDELFSDKRKDNKSNTITADKESTVVTKPKADVETSSTAFKTENVSNTLSSRLNIKEKNEKTSLPKAKSIFDNDSDDDLFSIVKTKPTKSSTNLIEQKVDNSDTKNHRHTDMTINSNSNKSNDIFIDDDNDLFSIKSQNQNKDTLSSNIDSKNEAKSTLNAVHSESLNSPSIFDEEDDDLFSKTMLQKEHAPVEIRTTKIISDHEVKSNPSYENAISTTYAQKDTKLLIEEVSEKTVLNIEPLLSKEEKSVKYDSRTSASEKLDWNNKQNSLSEIQDITENVEPSKSSFISNNREEGILENTNITEQSKEIIPNIVSNVTISNTSEVNDEDGFVIPDSKNKGNTISITNDSLNTAQNENLTTSPEDVFSKIISEPPVFEKNKESKKSKNVNALFDDDSEDESLFFKREVPISDEKPELFSNAKKPDLFGIFQNEPPEIDIDFEQKFITNDNFSTKINKSVNDISDEELLSNKSESTKKSDENIRTQISSTNTFDDKLNSKPDLIPDSPKSHDKSKVDVTNRIADFNNGTANVQNDLSKDNTDGAILSTETEIKKPIGKLKAMNFNINVNTLLPGASPKKIVRAESFSNNISKSEEKLPTNNGSSSELNKESSLVKSVSFDGDPESSVLDNKLSKERPKIQVKRRPSTRKARHEAARKSVINFDNHVTDNPSVNNTENELKNSSQIVVNDGSLSQSRSESSDSKDSSDHEKSSINISSSKSEPCEPNEIMNKKESDENTLKSENIGTDIQSLDQNLEIGICKDTEVKDQHKISSSKSKDVKSKIVYILNDEDIFNTKSDSIAPFPVVNDQYLISDIKATTNATEIDATEKTNFKSKVLNIVDDHDDDIFKSMMSSTDQNKGKSDKVAIKPSATDILNEEYKQTATEDNTVKTTDKITDTFTKDSVKSVPKSSDTKKSLFSDSSDEELFSKTTAKPKQKAILFDSDSDDELFGSKPKKSTSNQKEILESKGLHKEKPRKDFKKVDVKSSLFGDDDDEDLFGAASSRSGTTKPPSSKMEQEGTSTTVLEDPLSMFK